MIRTPPHSWLRFAVAAFFGVVLTSAGAPDALGQERQQAAPEAAPTPPDYSTQPFIYEMVRGEMHFENDGTGSREVRARIRVQTPAGLAKAGQLIFEYSAANEKIEIRSVRVIKPDGNVVTAGPDAVQDLSAPVAREAPMYSDARQKHVTVPGVAVGDAVEYDVVTTVIQPLMAGQFWQAWNLVSDVICLDEQVELKVPRDRPLKIKSPSGMEPTSRVENDRRIYHWTASTLQLPVATSPFKNFKFDVKDLLRGMRPPTPRQISFSTFQSWDEIAQWYSHLERERRTPTPEIRAQADEIVRGRTGDSEKLQALYEWVSRNVRYVSLSFGVGRYQPHSALEVLQNRYGDCKDKNTLLEALLESEGIRAEPALVNSRADIDPDVPSPLQFDHVITRVPFGPHEYWVDSTTGVGPFGYLLPQLRGKDALVVRADAISSLLKTPKDLPMATLYRIDVQGSVTDDGHIDLVLNFDTRGDLEVLLRIGIMALPPSQFMAIMETAAKEQANTKGAVQDFSIRDFKTGDPTDTSKPFHLQVSVRVKAPDTKKSDAGAASEPPREIARAFGSGLINQDSLLAFLPAVETKPGKSGKPEQQPVKLEGPTEFSLSFAFTLPAGKRSNGAPPEHHLISKDFAEYESFASWEGQTLHANWRLDLRMPEVPASHAAEYASFCQEVAESLGSPTSKFAVAPPGDQPPHLDKPVPSLPEHTPSPEAAEYFREAQLEFKDQDWADAEPDLESAAQLDPKYPQAWNWLGITRMNLRKYGQAEEAFRSLLELAPEAPLPYAQLAWSLTVQKKYTEASDLLEKRVQAAPQDADAYRRLGLAYNLLHQYDRAVPVLERATFLLPNNDSAHFFLARAYLETNQEDLGAMELERAVSLNGTLGARNTAAYLLAMHNTHLDRAEALSKLSFEPIERALNQSGLTENPSITRIQLTELAAYWDTLGWIKFQKGDFAGADKFIRAAWDILDDTTIVYHLGRVCLAQGKRSEAASIFAQALTMSPSDDDGADDQKNARKLLAEMLGGEPAVETHVKEAHETVKSRRSLSINNSAHAMGTTKYDLTIGAGSKLKDIIAATPSDPLAALGPALREVTLPQTLPDETVQIIPRTAPLTCSSPDQPCTFALMPVEFPRE